MKKLFLNNSEEKKKLNTENCNVTIDSRLRGNDKAGKKNFSQDRRNFLWKIWAVLWVVWIFWVSDLFARPNDSEYWDQELVFKKIGLDEVFDKFPELDWSGVKMWYITTNSVDVEYDMAWYNFKDLWWVAENGDFHNHANSMVSILNAERWNWEWIAWIVPGADLNVFKWKNEYDEICEICNSWINLVWSSLIATKYWKKIDKISEIFEENPNFIFLRAWWNDGDFIKSDPGNNLEKVDDVFIIWACDVNDNIHDFSAKECDFYLNTWSKWFWKWIMRISWWSYRSHFQTSEAAAVLTWIVWLLRQILPNSSREDIKNILQKSARKKYSDWWYLVDAYHAVKLAKRMV